MCVLPISSLAQLLQKYQLTDDRLRQKCSDDHLKEIAQFISWREVGPCLPEINWSVDLEDIDRDGYNEAERRRMLVNLWKQRNGDGATYHVMITAMDRARRRDNVCQLASIVAHSISLPPQ